MQSTLACRFFTISSPPLLNTPPSFSWELAFHPPWCPNSYIEDGSKTKKP